MVSVGRNVHVWIFITLIFLLGWIIYWIPAGIWRFASFDGTSWYVILQQDGGWMFMLMELSASVGMILRFIGVFLGILALKEFWPYNVWNRNKTFFDVKKIVGSALIFECCHFALLLPSGLFMVGYGTFTPSSFSFLGILYLLLVGSTVPFLAALAIKAFTFKGGPNGFRAWNLIAVTFVGYIASLWISIVVKSFSVLEEGFSTIFIGIGGLPLIFAVITAFYLVKQNFDSAIKWAGIALTIVGMYYLLYGISTFLVDMQSFLMLAEIWAVSLLGLGLALIRTKSKKNNS